MSSRSFHCGDQLWKQLDEKLPDDTPYSKSWVIRNMVDKFLNDEITLDDLGDDDA